MKDVIYFAAAVRGDSEKFSLVRLRSRRERFFSLALAKLDLTSVDRA